MRIGIWLSVTLRNLWLFGWDLPDPVMHILLEAHPFPSHLQRRNDHVQQLVVGDRNDPAQRTGHFHRISGDKLRSWTFGFSRTPTPKTGSKLRTDQTHLHLRDVIM